MTARSPHLRLAWDAQHARQAQRARLAHFAAAGLDRERERTVERLVRALGGLNATLAQWNELLTLQDQLADIDARRAQLVDDCAALGVDLVGGTSDGQADG